MTVRWRKMCERVLDFQIFQNSPWLEKFERREGELGPREILESAFTSRPSEIREQEREKGKSLFLPWPWDLDKREELRYLIWMSWEFVTYWAIFSVLLNFSYIFLHIFHIFPQIFLNPINRGEGGSVGDDTQISGSSPPPAKIFFKSHLLHLPQGNLQKKFFSIPISRGEEGSIYPLVEFSGGGLRKNMKHVNKLLPCSQESAFQGLRELTPTEKPVEGDQKSPQIFSLVLDHNNYNEMSSSWQKISRCKIASLPIQMSGGGSLQEERRTTTTATWNLRSLLNPGKLTNEVNCVLVSTSFHYNKFKVERTSNNEVNI